jgi:hypothetical protein
VVARGSFLHIYAQWLILEWNRWLLVDTSALRYAHNQVKKFRFSNKTDMGEIFKDQNWINRTSHWSPECYIYTQRSCNCKRDYRWSVGTARSKRRGRRRPWRAQAWHTVAGELCGRCCLWRAQDWPPILPPLILSYPTVLAWFTASSYWKVLTFLHMNSRFLPSLFECSI